MAKRSSKDEPQGSPKASPPPVEGWVPMTLAAVEVSPEEANVLMGVRAPPPNAPAQAGGDRPTEGTEGAGAAGLAPHSDSRVRARETWTKEQRALYIFGEMAAGRWNRAAALGLAQRLGLSLSTIHDSSAEAARLGTFLRANGEELKARLLGYLEDAIELARLDESPAKAAAAIAGCVGQAARLTGLDAPVKVAHTDTKGNDLPPAIRGIAGTRELLAFIALHDRLPTDAEAAELARAAGGAAELGAAPK